MKPLILAFQFLTILPLPHSKTEPGRFGQAMMYFPVVGLFLGAFLYGCHWAINFLNPPPSIQAFILMFASAVLTRALHLEGFADFLDGFLGGNDKTATLAIMKDSRAGVFAVIGLIFALLGNWLFLSEILANGKQTILLLYPVLSRWCMVLLCFRNRDTRQSSGLVAAFLDSLSFKHVFVSSVITFVWVALFIGATAIPVILIAVAVASAIRYLSKKKIEGVTGDVVGAACVICELAVVGFWAFG